MKYTHSEVLAKAFEIDPAVGEYLAISLVDKISYDMIEKGKALQGELIPISRTSFYRERKRLLQRLEKDEKN